MTKELTANAPNRHPSRSVLFSCRLESLHHKIKVRFVSHGCTEILFARLSAANLPDPFPRKSPLLRLRIRHHPHRFNPTALFSRAVASESLTLHPTHPIAGVSLSGIDVPASPEVRNASAI